MRVLRSSGTISAPRDRVFAVIEDARMADQLHPAFLRLSVVRSPWLPKAGERTQLDAVHRGVRLSIETELAEYRRGSFLLERQVQGPFASFEHAVSLEDDDNGTRLTEVLAYQPALGPLGRLFDAISLRRDLELVLATRLSRLRQLLEHA